MSEEEKKVWKKNWIGFPIGEPFYNHRKATEGGNMQLEIYNFKLGFEFNRYNPNKTGADAFEKHRENIEGDMSILLQRVLEYIVASRNESWKNKTPYLEFEIPLKKVFTDREQITHSVGNFYIRSSVISEEEGSVPRVQFGFKNDKVDFKVNLGSVNMPVISSSLPDVIERLDPYDTPLYRFLLIVKQYNNSGAILYGGFQKLSELINGSVGEYVPARGAGGNNGGGNNYNNNKTPSRGGPSFRPTPAINDAELLF